MFMSVDIDILAAFNIYMNWFRRLFTLYKRYVVSHHYTPDWWSFALSNILFCYTMSTRCAIQQTRIQYNKSAEILQFYALGASDWHILYLGSSFCIYIFHASGNENICGETVISISSSKRMVKASYMQ